MKATFSQAIITLMQTREDADFPVILDMLKSTEGASKSPNGNHILKWVLRFVSQEPLPMPGSGDDNPVAVKQKAEALKAGIERIKDFGNGVGFIDENGDPQEANADFLIAFKALLDENELETLW